MTTSPNREPAEPMRPVVDPAAWTPAELERDQSWTYTLSNEDIGELEAAVDSCLQRGIELKDITQDEIDLPNLGPVLDVLAEQLISGRGLVLIRGLPVARYSREESARAYWIIGTFFGEPVSQNAKGHLLGHVKDLGGTSFANPANRGYQTHDGLPFHSDSCDAVGLLCLHPSKSGGESTVTSSLAIYNEMLATDPELVAALCEPVYRDRRGEIPAGREPYFQLPVFNFVSGYLTVNWQGGYIRSAQRFEELPRHSPALTAALDLFTKLAGELAYEMEFHQGDIQFLHNHVTVHSRTAYVDYDEADKRRHLLRLWLATPNGRPLPEQMWQRYAVDADMRRPAGGVIVPGTILKTPLEAE